MKKNPLLKVQGLSISYLTKAGEVKVVDGLDFEVDFGERLAILGGSGSGKTTIALSLVGLLPSSAKVEGSIFFKGKPLKDKLDFSKIRGKGISIIFQQPHAYLNPIMTVFEQLDDVLRFGFPEMDPGEREERIRKTLIRVGLDGDVLGSYPFQLSGGMAQRVAIAQALILEPKLLIADEITSSLDMSLRRDVLNLILELQDSFDFGLIFITHDKSAVRYVNARELHVGNKG